MGQELATRAENSVTAWSEPRLPSSLKAELDSTTSYALATILPPDAYALVKAELERCVFDTTPCPPDKIAEMLANMAVIHPDAKLSDAEQHVRLRMYIKTLKDLPYDVLAESFLACAKTIPFFPKPAEIRAKAHAIITHRVTIRNRLATLALKHENEYLPPRDDDAVPSTPEERGVFNVQMRSMGLKMRLFDDGTMRRLEDGEEDPAPPPEEPPAPPKAKRKRRRK